MQTRKVIIALLALLFSFPALAQDQSGGLPYFPQVLPAGTVVGNPTNIPGATQAIPISSLGGQLSPLPDVIWAGSNAGTVTLVAPPTVSSYTLAWPIATGALNQLLATDGSGNLIWEGDGQIWGTSAADNAGAGYVGEYVTATTAAASAVTLTTATTANVATVTLSGGDWDCNGSIAFTMGGSTVTTIEEGDISATSATKNTLPGFGSNVALNGSVTGVQLGVLAVGNSRFSFASATPVYLVTKVTFTTSTAKAYGFLRCRRIR